MSELPPLDKDWQSKMELSAALWHMFGNQVGCDVVFKVGNLGNEDRIGAHSCVLMARSPVLFEEYASGLPDIEYNMVEYTKEEFECFLKYLYTNEVELGNNDIENVQKLSVFFKVHNLTKTLLEIQLDTLPVEKFCKFVCDHEESLLGMLEFKCFDYVFHHPAEVFQSTGFKYLPQVFLQNLITHDYLVLDEEVICTAVLLWASYHCEVARLEVNGENQREILGDMLYDIRFPLLDKDFFTENISEKQLLLDIEEVQLLKFYLNPKRQLDAKFKFKVQPREAPSEPFEPKNLDARSQVMRQSSLHPVPSRPIIHQFTAGEKGVVHRFREEGQGWGYRNNKMDAIAFTVDKKIRLDYVLIYGIKENNSMDVKLSVQENDAELASAEITIQCTATDASPHLHEIGVENSNGSYGIELSDNTEYHIILKIVGQCGYYGKQGQEAVSDHGVTFTFKKSKYSSNNTTRDIGQVMGFKFTVL